MKKKMKILSIDLDFISAPAINEFYTSGMHEHYKDSHAVIQWKEYQSKMPEVFESISHKIDIDNYDYCLRTYCNNNYNYNYVCNYEYN